MTRRKRGGPTAPRRFGWKWEVLHGLANTVRQTVTRRIESGTVDVEIDIKVKLSRLARAWKRQADLMGNMMDEAEREGHDVNVSDGIRWVNGMLKARDRSAGSGKAKKSHNGLYMKQWIYLENFILELYKNEPTNPDYEMVMSWQETFAPTFSQPISVDTLTIYFNHLKESPDKLLVPAAGLYGRALDFESIAQARKVMHRFEPAAPRTPVTMRLHMRAHARAEGARSLFVRFVCLVFRLNVLRRSGTSID